MNISRKFLKILLLLLVFPLFAHAQQLSGGAPFGTVTAVPAYLTTNGPTDNGLVNRTPFNMTLSGPSVVTSGPFTATAPTSVGAWSAVLIKVEFNPSTAGSYGGVQLSFGYHYVGQQSGISVIIYASGTYAPPWPQGFINPKYLIVGVTYAPPGPSSNVSYENSVLVGNTTTTTDTFMSGTNLTISASTDISAWSVVGGAAVKVKLTESTEYTQTSTTSNEVTISKQTDVKDTTNGTGNAFNPVNHDYDTIWLWLNPLLIYSVDPSSSNNVQWNGYGYDSHDPSGTGGPDVYPVLVGWLNGDFGSNSSIQQVLSRSWVTANEPGITWPSGQGPGLTGLGSPCPPPPGASTDICNILAADPFTSSYTLLSSLPSTSSDGRFTQIAYPPNPIPYTQAGPGNGGGVTTTYDAIYTDTHIVGKGTSHSFKQTFGLDSEFKGGTWFGKFTVDINVTQTLQWTHDWMNKLTTTNTLTKALSITGPGCPQTSPPCVPTYSGPGQFIVYQDNQYGTFLFYPSN